MSSATRCNRCSLEAMQRHAAAHGADVIVELVTDPHDPMVGWTSAAYSDEDQPSHYFLMLTEGCAC